LILFTQLILNPLLAQIAIQRKCSTVVTPTSPASTPPSASKAMNFAQSAWMVLPIHLLATLERILPIIRANLQRSRLTADTSTSPARTPASASPARSCVRSAWMVLLNHLLATLDRILSPIRANLQRSRLTTDTSISPATTPATTSQTRSCVHNAWMDVYSRPQTLGTRTTLLTTCKPGLRGHLRGRMNSI